MPIFVPKKSGKKYAHDMYCMYFNVISKWCEQECFIIIIGQLDGICFEKFTHRLCSYCDYHWLEQAHTAARQQHTEYFCICVCIVKAAEELAVAAALRKFASTNSIKYNIALCVCVFFSLCRVLLLLLLLLRFRFCLVNIYATCCWFQLLFSPKWLEIWNYANSKSLKIEKRTSIKYNEWNDHENHSRTWKSRTHSYIRSNH